MNSNFFIFVQYNLLKRNDKKFSMIGEKQVLKISEGICSRPIEWRQLCLLKGDIYQTFTYDKISSVSGHIPIYFELIESDKLVAGVRLFRWESRRFKKFISYIHKPISMIGQIMIIDDDEKKHAVLLNCIRDYIDRQGASEIFVKGFNGSVFRDIVFSKRKYDVIPIACLNIEKDTDIIINNFHKTHQRYLKKAQNNEDLVFSIESSNFELFYDLLLLTYEGQAIKPPSKEYLRTFWCHFYSENALDICFLKTKDGLYLNGVMAIRIGRTIHYAFGGNRRNQSGSGVLLHWNMINYYKSLRFEKLVFGEISRGSLSNFKGNTVADFKMRFGCYVEYSISQKLSLSKLKNIIWLLIKYIYNENSKRKRQRII